MQVLAKIDGVCAKRVFGDIDERISIAQKAANMFMDVYEMTGIDSFLVLANRELFRAKYMLSLINKNENLYYIVTKGYGLN